MVSDGGVVGLCLLAVSVGMLSMGDSRETSMRHAVGDASGWCPRESPQVICAVSICGRWRSGVSRSGVRSGVYMGQWRLVTE